MLKKEIIGTLKTKRAWIFLLLIMIIPLIDLGMVCKSEQVWDKRANKAEILEMDRQLKELSEREGYIYTSNWISHPANAAYLSGSSSGHLMQILLIWLMPLLILNLYSDRYISEFSRGYTNAILTRTSRVQYIRSKLTASFIIPSAAFLSGLLINFIAAQIIFMDGYCFQGMEVFKENGGWFALMYTYPNLVYLCYMLFTALLAGLCGCICQCIAFLCKKYTFTYIVSFFIWMAMIMMKDSIIYLVQPFTEYGMDYMIRGGAIVLVVTMLFAAAACLGKRKQDEL